MDGFISLVLQLTRDSRQEMSDQCNVPWCESDFSQSVPWLHDTSSSDDDDLVLLYSVSSRSHWVHPINKKRSSYGEFHHLMSDLEVDEEKFRQYFRLNKEQFNEVLSFIDNEIRKEDTNYRKAITSKERLAVCLRFLATGDTYRTICYSYRMGESTISKIVEEVCEALWKCMQPMFMPTPNEEIWRKIEQGFRTRWNFPHCIGAIDGKHVAIQAPPHSGSTFFNYKKYYSTVLLGLVDSEYKFITIDSGAYGKECDGGIFSDSTLGKRLNNYTLAIPPDEPLCEGGSDVPYVIVGDEGFPMKRFLLRPFPRDRVFDIDKRVYNYRLCRCRRVVENAFGILAQRWRIYFRPLACKYDSIVKIIKATTILHNYLCSKGDMVSVGTPEEILHDYETCWKPMPRYGTRASEEAKNVREDFVDYFYSEHGSVPWQWEHI